VVLLTIADVLRMVLRPVSASLEGPTPILILDMYSLLLCFEEREKFPRGKTRVKICEHFDILCIVV